MDVSVVMPTKIGSPWLGDALGSISIQHLDGLKLEVILVVDCRSTRDYWSPHVDSVYPGVRVLHVTSGARGISCLLNAGIKKAKGRHICRLDADDIMADVSRISKQCSALDSNTKLGVVGSRVKFLSYGGLPSEEIGDCALTDDKIRRRMRGGTPFYHPSVMIRKVALDSVGGYPQAPWCEDYALWDVLLQNWEGMNLSGHLTALRRHEGQASVVNSKEATRQAMRIMERWMPPGN